MCQKLIVRVPTFYLSEQHTNLVVKGLLLFYINSLSPSLQTNNILFQFQKNLFFLICHVGKLAILAYICHLTIYS